MKITCKKVLIVLLLIVGCICVAVAYLYNIIPHRFYNDAHFQIATVQSEVDQNQNGIDDYRDIVLGAQAEIQAMPTYRSAYYAGGYPPASEGVCTDVIWRSLAHAGYDFKAMVDADIASHPDAYPRVNGTPDPNIDFRRVPNVQTFLERHTLVLSTDMDDIEAWQAGDIVVFSDSHIGILSDKRNYKGLPFLLHNGNLPRGEEDCLWREHMLKGISGHYRFQLDEKKEGIL